jgi:hypothetical protein
VVSPSLLRAARLFRAYAITGVATGRDTVERPPMGAAEIRAAPARRLSPARGPGEPAKAMTENGDPGGIDMGRGFAVRRVKPG